MTDHHHAIVPLQIDLVRYSEPTADKDRQTDTPEKSERAGKGCDEILECVLPPRRWVDADGTRWTQRASNRSATRADVVALTETFEASLLRCRARDSGVCPTRRELYSRCFDEILRQVTVNCAERGLLLLKIGNEFQMTMDACRTLYESNVKRFHFTRSVLFAEPDARHGIAELEAAEAKKQKLERELAASIARYEMVQIRGNEQRALRQQRYDENKEFLMKINRNLRMFLEGIITLK